MSEKPRLAIVGAGALGRVVAQIASDGDVPTVVWSRNERTSSRLHEQLPAVDVTCDLREACTGVPLLVVAVPVVALREVASALGEIVTGDQIVVHAARGVEADLTLPHKIIRQETCLRKIGVLGGPLHAPDVVNRQPVVAVVASAFEEVCQNVSRITAATCVRVHASADLVGVEVAGAVSTVSALAVGMADALGMGDMARGVLLTRGLEEAAIVGVGLGARLDTFWGLAGVGDLIPRTTTSTDRHHRLGAALAEGLNLNEAQDLVGGSLEGVTTARALATAAKLRGWDTPLITAVAVVLDGTSPRETLVSLLQQDFELGARAVAG